MIVISAATGAFGRLVVERLLERVPVSTVAVAVRNPGKAEDWAAVGVEVRQADYDDPDSLRTAFAGADRLLFISAPVSEGPTSRLDQHRNVVAAARDAGGKRIFYTSGLGADVVEYGILGEHHATEQMIAESGLPYTLLRHPIYNDYLIHPGLQAAVDAGELTSNTRGRGLNMASRADLAEAAAIMLAGNDHDQNAYNFTGQLWTYPELAQVLSDHSGRDVNYREVNEDQGIIGMLGLAPFIQAGAFEFQTADLNNVLGHPSTSLQEAVPKALAPAST